MFIRVILQERISVTVCGDRKHLGKDITLILANFHKDEMDPNTYFSKIKTQSKGCDSTIRYI